MKKSFSQRVVLLGANGFVGSYLTEHLKERWVVNPLGRSEVDLTSSNATDQLREQLFPDDSVIFISALPPSRGRDIKTLMANLAMAENFCAYLSNGGQCRNVIYVSSDAVYGDDLSLAREISPCDPSSLHGIMHITREKMLLDVCTRKGIPLLRVRPCAIYGHGDPHNSYGPNRFVRSALEEGTIKLGGEGEERRDHVHISDVVSILARCLEAMTDGVLNIATGRSVSFQEVADCVSHYTGASVSFSPRQNSITHRYFDVTKLNTLFPDLELIPIDKGIKFLCSQGKSKGSAIL